MFRLDLATYQVRDVVWADESAYRSGTLGLRVEDLAADEPAIASIEFEIVRPGDNVRLIHLLDAVEPRWKASGRGNIFPGILGTTETVGDGRTHRLAGMALVQAARPPQPVTGLLQPREAVMDMWGEGARYSPLSDRILLLLQAKAEPTATNADFDSALRRYSCRLAEKLARLTAGEQPDKVEALELTPAKGLPRIGYFYQVQSQGIFSDTYLYGRPAENMVPTLIHPNEIIDGALVSGNYLYPPFHTPTALHQNNPLLLELYGRHGKELDFCAVVLARGHNYTQMEKERSAHYAAKLLRMAGCEAVVLTGEGGGNSAIDMMLTCQYLEEAGVRTSVVSYEFGGGDGADFPLVDWVPQADAMVSTGSTDKRVRLDAPGRVLGGESFVELAGDPRDAIQLTLQSMYASTCQVGAGKLAGAAF